MVHKRKQNKGDEYVEWGFDLTEVKSDEDFLKLLDSFGFKEVKSEEPTQWMKSRFKKGVTTFANPEGIRITVEHLGGKGEDKGFLGYIGIKAPKSALPKLQSFLKKFRGNEPIKELDFQGRRGIVKYVKQETPFESGFIGVD